MKHNLLLGTSLIAALATTSLQGRSASVMTLDALAANTTYANNIVIGTKSLSAELGAVTLLSSSSSSANTLLIDQVLANEAGLTLVANALNSTEESEKTLAALKSKLQNLSGEAQTKAVNAIAIALASDAGLANLVATYRGSVETLISEEAAAKTAPASDSDEEAADEEEDTTAAPAATSSSTTAAPAAATGATSGTTVAAPAAAAPTDAVTEAQVAFNTASAFAVAKRNVAKEAAAKEAAAKEAEAEAEAAEAKAKEAEVHLTRVTEEARVAKEAAAKEAAAKEAAAKEAAAKEAAGSTGTPTVKGSSKE